MYKINVWDHPYYTIYGDEYEYVIHYIQIFHRAQNTRRRPKFTIRIFRFIWGFHSRLQDIWIGHPITKQKLH